MLSYKDKQELGTEITAMVTKALRDERAESASKKAKKAAKKARRLQKNAAASALAGTMGQVTSDQRKAIDKMAKRLERETDPVRKDAIGQELTLARLTVLAQQGEI